MKLRLTALFLGTLLCSALPAQEPAPTSAPVTDAADAPATPLPDPAARTFIPQSLEVPAFIPPVPVVRKPPPPIRIDASVTRLKADGTTITLQRGEPSTQPDLPPPPPPAPYVAPHEPTPAEIARRIWNHRHNFHLGATIFDHRVSVVNWTDQETLVRYEAVCGFDIGLLAGVGGFVHLGEKYRFDLMHSHYETTAVRRLFNPWRVPVPAVAPGEILILKGDVTDTAATAPLTIVRDVIAAETNRLIPYQAAKAGYFKAYKEWAAAHPPVPRNSKIILRPHRGSRYLTNPNPPQP